MKQQQCTSHEKENLWIDKVSSEICCSLSLESKNMFHKAKPILLKPLLLRKKFKDQTVLSNVVRLASSLNIFYLPTLFVVGGTKMPWQQ